MVTSVLNDDEIRGGNEKKEGEQDRVRAQQPNKPESTSGNCAEGTEVIN
jgi:hypothetical protein